MTRKLLPALALLLVLAGCRGGAAPEEYDPEKTARAFLDAGVFSEELEALDADLISGVYGLDTEPESAVVYSSTGATAEEVVVLTYADQDGADGGLAALQQRVTDQKEACDGYLPLELPKLDRAIVKGAGHTVLLVVANDADGADATLKTLETP